MELAGALFLAGCVVAGFGITYLSGGGLNIEERIAFGAVLGAMSTAGFSFVFSLVVRDVTVLTSLLGLALAMAVGAVGITWSRARLVSDLSDARARWGGPLRGGAHPWPLLAVVLVCAAWTVHFLHQAYVYTPAGLFTGYVNIWGDWAAHLSFAGSFAYGHNFPPQYPLDPGHNLGYPFMVDFFAADLVPLGGSLTSALTATTGLLGLAFPAVLYLTAQRFAGGRLAAAIAVFVFLLSGGLGFLILIGDVSHGGFAALAHLPRQYTQNTEANLQWLNPVLAYLVPQRSTLFGFSLALIILVLLWLAIRERLGWRTFLFAGLVTSVTPAFHVHAYGTVVAMAAIWAVINRRREWAVFFAPALVVGVPILVWMWPPANNSICGGLPSVAGYCVQPGWLSFADWRRDGLLAIPWDFVVFWIRNTSLLAPLMLAAIFMRRWFATGFPEAVAPIWLWFAVPNLIVLQPWVWDNTKFFVFWALLGSVLAGGVLAGMLKSGPVAAIAAVTMLALMGLSGALDLTRASDFSVSSVQFTDPGGLEVAAWVRQHTRPSAVFVVADEHNSPIPTLAGRRVMVGYPAWLWTYGLPDYVSRDDDSKKILDGDPATPDLIGRYGIDYVMIGPQELGRGASRAYWDEHGTLVYDDGGYAIYQVIRT